MFPLELLDSLTLILYLIAVVVLPISFVLVAKILGSSSPNSIKNSSFECGQIASGKPHARLGVQYVPYVVVYATMGVLAVLLLLSAPSLLTGSVNRSIFAVSLIAMVMGLLSVAISFERKGGRVWKI